MDKLYTFYDYEEAYYHMRYHQCIEIGCYLLKIINDKRSKILYNKLCKVKYSWDMPEKKAEEFAKLLLDVKLWIMVNPR